MKIESRPSGITAVTFNGGLEIESVRRAFEEHNQYVTDRGNSVDPFARWVESWRGYIFKYTCKCYSLLPLVDPLEYFVDNTESRVDYYLDNWLEAGRLNAAAHRYRLMDVANQTLGQLVEYIGEDDAALAIY